MNYCNEFYSLSVLSLYEGELIGNVDKLYFDKKLKKLIELELVGEQGIRLILPTKNIYHIGKNAITVKNNQAVSLKNETNNFFPCPIGSKAYSINGEYLGIIKEISFNEKFVTEKVSLDNNTSIDLSLLASFGKNTIIFYDKNQKMDLKKFTPNKTPKTFKTEAIQIAQVLPVVPDEQQTTIEPKTSNIQSTDFLLGRICTKDIFNFNNEILIKAHAVINKKNLKEVNKYGKLRELMIYSK